MNINSDLLMASHVLKPHEDIARAEAVVSLVMNSATYGNEIPMEELKDSERVWGVSTAARTGGIFVFDVEDIGALRGAEWQPDLLPPLPFPRCWFEVWSDEDQAPVSFQNWKDYDEEELQLASYGVFEIEQAKKWRVYSVNLPSDGKGIVIIAWDIQAGDEVREMDDPKMRIGVAVDSEKQPKLAITGDKARGNWMRSLEGPQQEVLLTMQTAPVALAQMTHLLGARHISVSVRRPARRRFQRNWGLEHPNIYFVDLRATGETESGHSDREYRHRWIVRGHYRRDEAGKFNIPGKGISTWVRPYVKGPPGAPWKGRPVYHT